MASVQSSIRAEVSRGAFPEPMGVEAFTAYAIASAKQLIPEMENAARQTLSQPMSFEAIGEGLRLFEGWALRDLVNFRKHGMSKIKRPPSICVLILASIIFLSLFIIPLLVLVGVYRFLPTLFT